MFRMSLEPHLEDFLNICITTETTPSHVSHECPMPKLAPYKHCDYPFQNLEYISEGTEGLIFKFTVDERDLCLKLVGLHTECPAKEN